jgi:hypothetical protein
MASRLRLVIPLLLSISLLWVAPASVAAASRPFSMELLRTGDFVSQTNDVQCIGASIQMMLNMIGPRDDRTPRTQGRLQQLARQLSQLSSDPQRRINRERRGASVRGWARALPQLGAGHYVLVSEATMDGALNLAARAMARTGRPVGLLVWRGRHAWVMTGVRTTADPLGNAKFSVTSVTVADPWYPRNSSIWGISPRPGSRLTPGQLGQDFLPLNRSWMSTHRSRYVLVLPVTNPPQPALVRAA